jgi:DNA primase
LQTVPILVSTAHGFLEPRQILLDPHAWVEDVVASPHEIDAIRARDRVVVVEGYLDAIACHQYGAQNAVATLGTALTEGHLRLMRRFAQNLVLIFDPDPAGVKAAMRGLDLFVSSGMKVNVVSLPDNDDPDTFLKKNGYEAFASCLRKSQKFMDFVAPTVGIATEQRFVDE